MNKKLLAVAVSSALAVPMAAHAVKYKLSGQVNRAMVAADNGSNSDIQFIDNGSSNSRWRMKGSEDIGNGMKAGFNWEWAVRSNANGGDIGDPSSKDSTDLRLSEIWFSGGWGKVSLGKGNGAGNGTTEIDLSDTWNVAYSGRTSFVANVLWRDSSGGTIGGGGGLSHGDTFSAYDAFSRYDRLRYDSPSLGPVVLSVSGGAVDLYEGAARWSQGLGGGQISAGLFYGKHSDGGVKNRYGGAVAYLFSFGTNLLISYAENEPSGAGSTKAKTWYAKVGHKWGNNAVSIGYGEAKDTIVDYTDKGFNIGFNHNIPKAKVDLYAGYHFNQLDVPSGVSDADDIQAFVIGAKLKFE